MWVWYAGGKNHKGKPKARAHSTHRSEKHKNQWKMENHRRQTPASRGRVFVFMYFCVQRNKFTTFAVDVGVFRRSIFRLLSVYIVLVCAVYCVCCVLGRYFAHPHETEVRTLVECATPKREKMGGVWKLIGHPMRYPISIISFAIQKGPTIDCGRC